MGENEEADDFVYFLYFSQPNEATYIAGWYMSEIAISYTGQYAVEDGILTLELTDDESSDTISGTYAYTLDADLLLLTNESGDSLSWQFDTGVPMEFRAVYSQ